MALVGTEIKNEQDILDLFGIIKTPLSGLREEVRGSDQLSAVEHVLRTLPGGVVAGGAARWIAAPFSDVPEMQDIDVFLQEEKLSLQDAATLLSAAGYCPDEKPFTWLHESHTWPIQLVVREGLRSGEQPWRSAWDVIAMFAFTAEMWALEDTRDFLELTTTAQAVADTLTKTIAINNIIDPIRAAYRLNKYGLKGFDVGLADVAGIFRVWDALTEDQRAAWYALDSRAAY
jgi:hypothetical protein